MRNLIAAQPKTIGQSILIAAFVLVMAAMPFALVLCAAALLVLVAAFDVVAHT